MFKPITATVTAPITAASVTKMSVLSAINVNRPVTIGAIFINAGNNFLPISSLILPNSCWSTIIEPSGVSLNASLNPL